jgi:hypothetical protein
MNDFRNVPWLEYFITKEALINPNSSNQQWGLNLFKWATSTECKYFLQKIRADISTIYAYICQIT